jgi:hypothetical protein
VGRVNVCSCSSRFYANKYIQITIHLNILSIVMRDLRSCAWHLVMHVMSTGISLEHQCSVQVTGYRAITVKVARESAQCDYGVCAHLR